jgi:glycosyltransferase involved in cell wall biosynthesis
MTGDGSDSATIFDRELSCFWDHAVIEAGGRYYIEPVKLRVLEIVTGRFRRVRLLCRVESGGAGADALEGRDPLPGRFTVLPVLAGRLPRGRLAQIASVFRAAPRVLRLVREADLVYARHQGLPVFQLAALFTLLLGKDLVVTVGGNSKKSYLLRRGAGRRPGLVNRLKAGLVFGLDRWIARRADVALISGARLRAELGGRGHVFSSHAFDHDDIFERADTCGGPAIRWLYTGTLSPEKGIDTLLEDLALVRTRDSGHRLTLAGKDREPPAWVVDLIASRGLAADVDCCGGIPFGPRLFDLYRKSDVFVFPSLHEGMPKSPMEALGQGLPVITTEAGGGEYIRPGENGLVVAPGDPHALAEAVLRLVSDEALRRRLIANGLETAAQNTFDLHQEAVAGIMERSFR